MPAQCNQDIQEFEISRGTTKVARAVDDIVLPDKPARPVVNSDVTNQRVAGLFRHLPPRAYLDDHKVSHGLVIDNNHTHGNSRRNSIDASCHGTSEGFPSCEVLPPSTIARFPDRKYP